MFSSASSDGDLVNSHLSHVSELYVSGVTDGAKSKF